MAEYEEIDSKNEICYSNYSELYFYLAFEKYTNTIMSTFISDRLFDMKINLSSTDPCSLFKLGYALLLEHNALLLDNNNLKAKTLFLKCIEISDSSWGYLGLWLVSSDSEEHLQTAILLENPVAMRIEGENLDEKDPNFIILQEKAAKLGDIVAVENLAKLYTVDLFYDPLKALHYRTILRNNCIPTENGNGISNYIEDIEVLVLKQQKELEILNKKLLELSLVPGFGEAYNLCKHNFEELSLITSNIEEEKKE